MRGKKGQKQKEISKIRVHIELIGKSNKNNRLIINLQFQLSGG